MTDFMITKVFMQLFINSVTTKGQLNVQRSRLKLATQESCILPPVYYITTKGKVVQYRLWIQLFFVLGLQIDTLLNPLFKCIKNHLPIIKKKF